LPEIDSIHEVASSTFETPTVIAAEVLPTGWRYGAGPSRHGERVGIKRRLIRPWIINLDRWRLNLEP
jgi:hypothetical protein